MNHRRTLHPCSLLLLVSLVHGCTGTDKISITESEDSGPLDTAVEVVDVDGDGIAAEDDCDDEDPTVGVEEDWYADSDEDGFGNVLGTVFTTCTPPSGYVSNAEDCDDSRNDIHPDADEVCDEIDNDCDSEVDEEAVDARVLCSDEDGDGFGSETECIEECTLISGWVENDTDCDDANFEVNPDAPERCNGIDDDCDGTIDDDVDVWNLWMDVDGDGYGDPESPLCGEEHPDAVANDEDCDDADESINPDGIELCNGIDEDCDGLPDDGACSCDVELYDERPYQFCTEDENWDGARIACEGDGYHLVTVDDAKENAWLSDTADLYASHNTWWIGYSDYLNEGTWVWWDGTPSGFENWNRGEPNGEESENCAHFYTSHHIGHGVWNDENCASAKRYVCEYSP